MSLKDSDTETLDNVLKARTMARKVLDLLDKTVEFSSQSVAKGFFDARKLASSLESALAQADLAIQGLTPDQLDLFGQSRADGDAKPAGPDAADSAESVAEFFDKKSA